MIKVLVADDHAVVRTGLKQFFASTDDIEIVAEARTGEEALSLARKDNCDVVLLDIGLPTSNGLEVLKRIRAARPQVPVLIFSMFSEDEFATSALVPAPRVFSTRTVLRPRSCLRFARRPRVPAS